MPLNTPRDRAAKERWHGISDLSREKQLDNGSPRRHKFEFPRERLKQSSLSNGDCAILLWMSESTVPDTKALCRDDW